jgi:alkanesulfonate monooxygenase SsuD/methylene tetrahydromethanopterin reductase-like flavin-dependent oxidoreductase (luciferase family)
MPKPVVALVAAPTKRAAAIETAQEIERRGFGGIACPTLLGGATTTCASLTHTTSTIPFSTAIQPIYLQSPRELAATAGHLHELSGGRFRLGLGISHVAMLKRFGTAPSGRPLSDVRDYVAALRDAERSVGELPPIHLAAMRDKMLGLATEIADGALWANAARSTIAGQLERVAGARRDGFSLANMIPTVISDDLAAARAIHRRTMAVYVTLPNYRNYWKSAGYVEEMEALEGALERKERDRLPELMSDAWLDDCTLSGPASRVQEVVDASWEMGVQPILVMSSTSGGQLKAIQELFAAYE